MYPGMVNSPPTVTTGKIGDTDTTIPVEDLAVFPPAPNFAVLGINEIAETVLYTGKSGTSGPGNLTGCLRGFQGDARGWLSGSPIARNMTAYDYDTLLGNYEEYIEGRAIMLGIDVWSDDVNNLLVRYPIQFSANIQSEKAIATYDWDFGDNTSHSSEISPRHTYQVAGIYTVVLTVVDSDGNTKTSRYTLNVLAFIQSWIDQGVYCLQLPVSQSTQVSDAGINNFPVLPTEVVITKSDQDELVASTNYSDTPMNTVVTVTSQAQTITNT